MEEANPQHESDAGSAVKRRRRNQPTEAAGRTGLTDRSEPHQRAEQATQRAHEPGMQASAWNGRTNSQSDELGTHRTVQI